MGYKITLQELLKIAECAGRISGIADGMNIDDADKSTMTETLYMVAQDLRAIAGCDGEETSEEDDA